MSDVPIKPFTPYDLSRYAEMIGRAVSDDFNHDPRVELVPGRGGRCRAVVTVTLRGRPDLIVTVEPRQEPEPSTAELDMRDHVGWDAADAEWSSPS